jgi:hypothetical protein
MNDFKGSLRQETTSVCLKFLKFNIGSDTVARGSVVGRGTMLQAGRSLARVQMMK